MQTGSVTEGREEGEEQLSVKDRRQGIREKARGREVEILGE